MPGPPAGPSLRMTTTSPGSMRFVEDGRHRALLALEHARRTAVAAALVAGELHDAALRGEVAAQDREAAGRLERVAERAHDVLALGSRSPRRRGRRSCGRSTVMALSWSSPASCMRFATSGTPPAAYRSVARYFPPGWRSQSSGVRSEMPSKSSMSSSTPASRATASRCRTTFVEPPDIADRGDRVLERVLRDDLARAAGRA